MSKIFVVVAERGKYHEKDLLKAFHSKEEAVEYVAKISHELKFAQHTDYPRHKMEGVRNSYAFSWVPHLQEYWTYTKEALSQLEQLDPDIVTDGIKGRPKRIDLDVIYSVNEVELEEMV